MQPAQAAHEGFAALGNLAIGGDNDSVCSDQSDERVDADMPAQVVQDGLLAVNSLFAPPRPKPLGFYKSQEGKQALSKFMHVCKRA